MSRFGVHFSHELMRPDELVGRCKSIAEIGYSCGMCSDHFHPWSTDQRGCGFTWSWLGAALEATSMSLGTVCCPGYRYHPAIIAQACATLAIMYPGRFWLAVGTGEALNEHIVLDRWPDKQERQANLEECVEVMRRLWRGETVNHRGLVRVNHAKLYATPQQPPALFCAALTPETAQWAGGWADGLITAGAEPTLLREILSAFREGGGQDKPTYLQSTFTLDQTMDEALRTALRNWRVASLSSSDLSETKTPDEFDSKTASVRAHALIDKLRVTDSAARVREWIAQDAELGFDVIHLHQIGHDWRIFSDIAAAEPV